MEKIEQQSTQIHPTAIVDPGAKIGKNVHIGPYCLVGPNAELGDNVILESNVIIDGWTIVGAKTKISPFAVVGGPPQHTRYAGEPTKVIIGENCIIRESATVHRGTVFGNNETTVGSNTYLMAYSHVAHDCIVGQNVILANAVQLAGHVLVEDNVTIGGSSAVAQFCRVGRYCYVGGGSILRKDLPPFMVGKGTDFEVQGINVVGLTRKGFTKDIIRNLKDIYKIFYMQGLTLSQSRSRIEDSFGLSDEAKVFLEFTKDSKVGYIR